MDGLLRRFAVTYVSTLVTNFVGEAVWPIAHAPGGSPAYSVLVSRT